MISQYLFNNICSGMSFASKQRHPTLHTPSFRKILMKLLAQLEIIINYHNDSEWTPLSRTVVKPIAYTKLSSRQVEPNNMKCT